MEFADLIDVGKTMEEFRKEWLLRYTPNDLKFWAPRLESDIPAEKICASMLLEAWGCDDVFTQYETWVMLQENRGKIEDTWSRYERYSTYSSDKYYQQYRLSRMTWPEYWSHKTQLENEIYC